MKKIFWFLFVTSIIWGSSLPGIPFPMIGTLYPLRIILVISILGLIFQRKGILQKDKIAINTYVFWGLMLMYGFLTITWAMDKGVAVTFEAIYVTSFLIIITCLAFIRSREDIYSICTSFLLNVWIIGLLAIYESITGLYIFYEGSKYIYMYNPIGLKMPVLFFGNVNNLATFMAISIPICFIACENMRFKKLNKSLILILCSIIVLLIDSRAALIAILLFIYLNFLYHFSVKRLFIIVLLGFTILQIFSEVIFQAELWSLLESVNSENIRLLIWKNTFLTASDSFFIGAGPGNGYLSNLTQYYDTGGIFAIHNYFLEIFSEFGFIGFACFIVWVIKIFSELLKTRTYAKQNDKRILNFFTIFMFQYLILTICASSMAEMYFMWLIWAIIIAYIILVKREKNINKT